MVLQPLSRQERIENLLKNLEEARKLLESQAHVASIEWLDNFAAQFEPGFKFVRDHLRYANRARPYMP